MDFQIGIVDAFKLCSLHVDLFGDCIDLNPNSVGNQLMFMYSDLKSVAKSN